MLQSSDYLKWLRLTKLTSLFCLCSIACKSQKILTAGDGTGVGGPSGSPTQAVQPVQKKPITETSIPESKLTFADVPKADVPWDPAWNLFISEAIDNFGADLLSNDKVPKKDITELCPGFFDANNNQKKSFWALFIASFARYESGFNTHDRSNGGKSLNYVFNEGLLQLSYSDGIVYQPNCKLNKDLGNISDPKTNLQCGVAILSKQVNANKGLFPEKYSYWSVLTDLKEKIKRDFLKSATQLSFCKK